MSSADKTDGTERLLLRNGDLLPLPSDQADVSGILLAGSTLLLVRSLEPSGDLTGSFTIDAQAHQLILRIDDRPVGGGRHN